METPGKIQNVVEIKEEEQDIKYYKLYNKMFLDVIEYLKTQKVLLYGGQAIHELMPTKYKIYPKYKLPDIDIFTLNGHELAKKVQKFLERKKYQFPYIKEALKQGTYKVYAESIPILDITTISRKLFIKLSENSSIKQSGLRIVNPLFLRLSMHMILSQSTDAFRWEKTYKRLINYYKVFKPLSSSTVSTSKSNIPQSLIDNTYKTLDNTNCILFGMNEFKKLNIHVHNNVPKFVIVIDKEIPLHVYAKELINALTTDSLTTELSIGIYNERNTILPEHIFINCNSEPFIVIFFGEVCLTYHLTNICSIHTVMRLYLGMLILSSNAKVASNIKQMMDNLTTKLLQKKSKNKLLDQFIPDCFGENLGLVTLRRERMIRENKK